MVHVQTSECSTLSLTPAYSSRKIYRSSIIRSVKTKNISNDIQIKTENGAAKQVFWNFFNMLLKQTYAHLNIFPQYFSACLFFSICILPLLLMEFVEMLLFFSYLVNPLLIITYGNCLDVAFLFILGQSSINY